MHDVVLVFICRYGAMLFVECAITTGEIISVSCRIVFMCSCSIVFFSGQPYVESSTVISDSWPILNLVIHADFKYNSYLQVIIQIAIGTYTFYELLPSLGHLFAAIGSASVIYDIIDTVSL